MQVANDNFKTADDLKIYIKPVGKKRYKQVEVQVVNIWAYVAKALFVMVGSALLSYSLVFNIITN